jgi:hypothetical protein
VIGIGLGNIFSGKAMELKTKDNFTIASSPSIQTTNTSKPINNIINNVSQPIPTKHVYKKARVLFDYKPTQPDELELNVGELIYIISKNCEDEGWWRGKSISSGRIGLFPDNFVEELLSSTQSPNMSSADNKKIGNINKNELTTNEHSGGILLTKNNKIESVASSTSASSTTSSNNSLSNRQQQQNQTNTQINPTHNIQLEYNKSNSDLSDKLDEIQTAAVLSDTSRLTHIKKARQLNKRPPSFKSKAKV